MQTSTQLLNNNKSLVPKFCQHRKISIYKISLLIYLIFGFSALNKVLAQNTFTSKASGSWDQSSSWTKTAGSATNNVPGALDEVFINSGHQIEVDNTANCAKLTLNPVAGINATNTYSLQIRNNKSLSVSGDVFLYNSNSPAQITDINIKGTLTIGGNMTIGGGSGTQNTRISIVGSNGSEKGKLIVTGDVIFATQTPKPIVNINDGSELYVGKNLDDDGNLQTNTNSTVIFNGATAQTVPGYNYHHVITEGAGLKTLNGNAIVSGNFTIKTGSAFNNNDKIIQGSGTLLKTFEVQSGATFIASGSKALPTDFTTTSLQAGSIVEYIGNGTAQFITPTMYSNLKLSGLGTKTLGGNTIIAQNLNLNSSSIILSNYDLTVQPTAAISNYGSARYIQQTGTGKLIIQGLTGNSTSEVIFPVGTTSSYSPAYIKNVGDIGGSGNYSVLVKDGINDINNQPLTTLVAKRTWEVNRILGTGSPNITLRLQWDPATDEGLGFARTNVGIAQFTGGTWQQPLASTFTDGSSTFSATLAGITIFSKFGVVNPNSPLPVELISFTVTKKDNAAYLQWATASEKNNEGFHIQTSTDGKNFEDIGFVASHNPNSVTQQQYDFLDKTINQTGLRYYRLKQTDFDGTVSFSGIKVVNFDQRNQAPLIYPNPFNEQINVSIEADKDEELHYQLVDLTGKTVFESTQKLIKGNNVIQINLGEKYPAGVYLLKTQTKDSATSNRILRQ